MSAYVRTLLGGNIEPPTPEGYEQIVNYTMLYDEGQTELNWNTLAKGTAGERKLNTYYAGLEASADTSSTITATLDTDSITLKQVTNALSGGSNGLGCSPLVYTDVLDLSDYSKCFADVTSYISGYDIPTSESGVYALLHANENCGADVLLSTALAEAKSTARHAQGTYRETISIDISDIASSRIILGSKLHGGSGTTSQPSMTRYIKGTHIILAKADDIETLCDKAGVSTTTLEALLTDTTSLTAIFNSEDAVKYMVAQCTGDFMVGVLNSAEAVALLKASPYLNTVVGNPHWAKFMMMIPTTKELLNVTMLYDEGDECTDVTGGWIKTYHNSGSGGSFTKNANSITVKGSTNTSAGECGAGTTNKVNTSGFNTLYANVISATRSTYSGDDYNYSGNIGTSTSSPNYQTGRLTQEKYLNAGLWSVDISSQTEINVYVRVVGTASSGTATFNAVFLTKADDFTTWASLAGIAASDLDTLLADSASMATLMSNEKAVKYMVGCTGDLMVSICNSEVAMNALVSNIAYDYAFNHPVWYKIMTMCPVSLAAMDSVAVTVPTMTSATMPSGVVSASSEFSSTYAAYKAFDNSQGTYWAGAQAKTAIGSWVAYEWAEKMIPYKIRIKPAVIGTKYRGDGVAPTFTIQGLSDSDEWVDIESFTANTTAEVSSNYTEDYIISNPDKPYRALRYIMVTNPTGGTKGSNIILGEINFYGKAVD